MIARFELQGDKDLIRKLNMLGEKQIPAVLEKAALAASEIVREEAAQRAPVDTGTLSRNISKETVEKSKSVVEVNIGPGPQAFYGKFVELGTVKQPPHPFLRPAAETKQNEATKAFSKVLEAELEKARE